MVIGIHCGSFMSKNIVSGVNKSTKLIYTLKFCTCIYACAKIECGI